MAKAVNMAHDAGIPVLAYDRLITDCDLDLYMTFDNEKVGELQAQFLVDQLPKDRKKKIVRIYGAKTDNNALLYKRGQDKVLDSADQQGRDRSRARRLDAGLETGKREENRERGNYKSRRKFRCNSRVERWHGRRRDSGAERRRTCRQDSRHWPGCRVERLSADRQRHSGNDDLQTAFAACETGSGSGDEDGEKQTGLRARQNQQWKNRRAFNPSRRRCGHKRKHDGHRGERRLSQGGGRLSQSARSHRHPDCR